MLDYSMFTEEVISAWKIDKKLDLGKCVPIILHTNNQFSLHPSMITNNIDKEVLNNKAYNVLLGLAFKHSIEFLLICSFKSIQINYDY